MSVQNFLHDIVWALAGVVNVVIGIHERFKYLNRLTVFFLSQLHLHNEMISRYSHSAILGWIIQGASRMTKADIKRSQYDYSRYASSEISGGRVP